MNVDFSPTILEDFLLNRFYDTRYDRLRELATVYKVPSLEPNVCTAITNFVSIKKPKYSIEIGSGIGVSTLAIIHGYPSTELYCLDGNLERHLIHKEIFKDYSNIHSYQMRGETYLATDEMCYDFALIDSVKREYRSLYQKLKPRLNSNALIIFDDILIYGYIATEESETPYKYRNNRLEVLDFLDELQDDKDIDSMQILPIAGGVLTVSMK